MSFHKHDNRIQYYKNVGEYVAAKKYLSVSTDMRVEKLIDLMRKNELRSAIVPGKEGIRPVGLITEHGILKRLYKAFPDPMEHLKYLFQDGSFLRVRDVMIENPVCMPASLTIEEALDMIKSYNFSTMPIYQIDKLLGTITMSELYDIEQKRFVDVIHNKDILLSYIMQDENYGSRTANRQSWM